MPINGSPHTTIRGDLEVVTAKYSQNRAKPSQMTLNGSSTMSLLVRLNPFSGAPSHRMYSPSMMYGLQKS